MSFLTSREQVAPQGIGKPVRRREDARLLTGGGRFADETNLPDQGYACMVRSPHAHALIASIDTEPAEGMPGVIAVLTGSADPIAVLRGGIEQQSVDIARVGPPAHHIQQPIAAALIEAELDADRPIGVVELSLFGGGEIPIA